MQLKQLSAYTSLDYMSFLDANKKISYYENQQIQKTIFIK